MNKIDLTLTTAALTQKASELKKTYLKQKMDAAIQKGPKDVHSSARLRDEIARLKTRITQLERTQKANG